MSTDAQRIMQQLCTCTQGRHTDGAIDYFLIGRVVGLTEAETVAAICELAAGRYVTHGTVSRAVFLTDEGASWCRHGQPGDATGQD